jgi:hypothetical protein
MLFRPSYNPQIEKIETMAEVVTYSIFSSAWFWLLAIAILFFVIGIILLAFVATTWGVLVLLLGVVFLIVTGVVGFISTTRQTAVDILNTPAGAQLLTAAINPNVPIVPQGPPMMQVQRPAVVTTTTQRPTMITQNVPVQPVLPVRSVPLRATPVGLGPGDAVALNNLALAASAPVGGRSAPVGGIGARSITGFGSM